MALLVGGASRYDMTNVYIKRPSDVYCAAVWDAITTGIIYDEAWVSKSCSGSRRCNKPPGGCHAPGLCPACGGLLAVNPANIQTPSATAGTIPTSGLSYALRFVYEGCMPPQVIRCRCGANMFLCLQGYIGGCATPAMPETDDII